MSHLLQQITQAAGRHKRAQRIGRGEGSKGKTSGRGQKGAGSRAGSNKRIGFEGGQTEAYRRFPQRGFSNKPFETKFHVVNLSALERFDEGSTVDGRALKQAGLIPNMHQGVKVLGNGTLGKKLTIVAASFSRSAHQAITGAGGEAQDTNGQPFQFREPKNRRQAAKLDKRLNRLGLPPRERPAATDDADVAGDAGATAESSEQTGKSERAAGGEAQGKPPKRSSKKAASARPDGESGDVTEAPESGTKESAAKPRGRSKKSEAPTDAPESGDKTGDDD